MGAWIAVFRNRNLALLLFGRLVSAGGDYVYFIALSIAIFQYSGGKSFYIGLFWAVRLVPALLLGPFTGALADRLGYRLSMITADLARMALVLLLALLLHGATWGAIFPFAFLIQAFSSLFRPASVGLVPKLIRSKDERLAANAAVIQIQSAALIVGSAVGGIVAGGGHITALLIFDAGSFGVSALTLWFLRPSSGPVTASDATKTETEEERLGFVDGFKVLTRRPPLIFAVLVMALPELASGSLAVWIVPYAEQTLHLGGNGVGYLYAILGLGIFVGGLVAATIGGSVRLDNLLAASVLVGGVALGLLGFWPAAVPALACVLVIGLAESVEYAAYETLLQQSVPGNMIGQASGTVESLFFNLVLIGNVLSGLIAAWLGLTFSLAALGGLVVLTTAIAWLNLRRQTADRPDAAALGRIPVFASLPESTREWAVRRMLREQFAPQSIIVRQGDIGDRFYAIASGRAEVNVASDTGVATRELGPGDVFGEIALIQHVPRTATVTAVDPLTVYTLSSEEFEELQKRASEFTASLLETANARLADDTNFKVTLATGM